MRAPVIVPIFGTALRAWWMTMQRLGASLAYLHPQQEDHTRDRGGDQEDWRDRKQLSEAT